MKKGNLVVLLVFSLILITVGALSFVVEKYNLLNYFQTNKTYKSDNLGIEFQYPKNFYLLEKYNKIFIDNSDIVYNDFFGDYPSSIQIIPATEQELNNINILENKSEENTVLGNNEVRVIKGIISPNRYTVGFNYITVIFKNKSLILEAQNVRFVGNKDLSPAAYDFEKVIKDIASSIKFIK